MSELKKHFEVGRWQIAELTLQAEEKAMAEDSLAFSLNTEVEMCRKQAEVSAPTGSPPILSPPLS